MNEETQMSLDGGEVPWEEAGEKAQKAMNKKERKKSKQADNDEFVLGWMRELGYPVSMDELADRLKPVGMNAPTVNAAMRRLRKNFLIISNGDHDENCPDYKVLSNFRWQPVTMEQKNRTTT